MSHTENLIMNTVREALGKMQSSGVGYIEAEGAGEITYCIDDKFIVVSVKRGESILGL